MRRLTATRRGIAAAYRCEFCDGRPVVIVGDGHRAIPLCRFHEAAMARLLPRPHTTTPVFLWKTGVV